MIHIIHLLTGNKYESHNKRRMTEEKTHNGSVRDKHVYKLSIPSLTRISKTTDEQIEL